jgi:RNA polymerase sigma factor (sigma-70 family)
MVCAPALRAHRRRKRVRLQWGRGVDTAEVMAEARQNHPLGTTFNGAGRQARKSTRLRDYQWDRIESQRVPGYCDEEMKHFSPLARFIWGRIHRRTAGDIMMDARLQILLDLQPIIKSRVGDRFGDDVFQEVFLKAISPGFPWPTKETEIPAYVMRTAINTHTQMLRRERHLSLDSPDVQRALAKVFPRGSDSSLESERADTIRTELTRLPEDDRDFLEARFVRGEKDPNLAARLQVQPSTIRTRRHRLIGRLRKKLLHPQPHLGSPPGRTPTHANLRTG